MILSMKNKVLFNAILIILILLFATFGFKFLANQKKHPKPIQTLSQIPVVQTQIVRTQTEQIIFSAQGTVEAREVASLVPQVGGKVIFISKSLKPGAIVRPNQLLLKIDPASYKIAFKQAKASVIEAKANLTLVQSKATEAIWAWQLEHKGPPPPLVVKEPQLKQAEAKLAQAKASLEQAELNLKRTSLYAPFKARVIERKIGLGQYISPGQTVATLYEIDNLEVKVPIEQNKLKWINPIKTKVKIIDPNTQNTWEGKFVRISANIDTNTRLLYVYVKVFNSKNLLPGSFVKVKFYGKNALNVCWIPEIALHDFNIVWTVKNDKIYFKKVQVLMRKENKVLVHGLKDKDEIIISPLGEVKQGLAVKIVK
ncbi:efflux RND transporter periplasmic adaptor subunit [Desulfonauticus submarinus]